MNKFPSCITNAHLIETHLWAEYEARRKENLFGRRFSFACGVVMALIITFNAWLVYLIWFSR